MKCKICGKESDMPFHTCKRPTSVGMTLDEMKLAVARKMPEVIRTRMHGYTSYADSEHLKTLRWVNKRKELGDLVDWKKEGLQVCHEAEKLLTQEQIQDYFYALNDVIGLVDSTSPAWLKEWSVFAHASATYKQRLEALCRVWFPERFE